MQGQSSYSTSRQFSGRTCEEANPCCHHVASAPRAWPTIEEVIPRSDSRGSDQRFKFLHRVGLLFVCSGVLMYLSYLSIHRFCLRETATADKYLHIAEVDFPEITLCPSNPYKQDVLRSHGIQDIREVQFQTQWLSRVDEDLDPQEFLAQITIPLADIFHAVQIDTEKPIGNVTQTVLDGRKVGSCTLEPLWGVKEYYFNGVCFSLSFPGCLLELGILEMSIKLLQSTDIFIHHPGQYLSPNSRNRVKLAVHPRDRRQTTNFKIAATYEVIVLDASTGKCMDFEFQEFDFDQCMYNTLFNLSMAMFNCTVPWLPNRSHICVDQELRTRAFELYQNNRRNQFEICDTPCAFTNVYFGPPVEEYQSDLGSTSYRAELVVYFRRDVKVTSEYFLVSEISLIAEIGGYASLLLGFSLFNLTDLADFAYKKFGWVFRLYNKKPIPIMD